MNQAEVFHYMEIADCIYVEIENHKDVGQDEFEKQRDSMVSVTK